jgi:hypothetical protein
MKGVNGTEHPCDFSSWAQLLGVLTKGKTTFAKLHDATKRVCGMSYTALQEGYKK